MDEKDEKRHDSPVFKRGAKRNSDLARFAFFLLLSFLFWYLNFLGKEAETSVVYQLSYEKVPETRTLIAQGPCIINLSLKGTGYSIIKLKVSGTTTPLSVDLSKVTYRSVSGIRDQNYYILTSGLVNTLSSQLRSGCEIISVKPDTLFFTLSRKETVKGR